MGWAFLSSGVKFPELLKDTTQAPAGPGVTVSPCPGRGGGFGVAGVTSLDWAPAQRQVDGDVGGRVRRRTASRGALPEAGFSAWTQPDSDHRGTRAPQIPRAGLDFLHAQPQPMGKLRQRGGARRDGTLQPHKCYATASDLTCPPFPPPHGLPGGAGPTVVPSARRLSSRAWGRSPSPPHGCKHQASKCYGQHRAEPKLSLS